MSAESLAAVHELSRLAAETERPDALILADLRWRVCEGEPYGDRWMASAHCTRCGYVPIHPTLIAVASCCTFTWDGQGYSLYHPHLNGDGAVCEHPLTPMSRT